LEHGDRPFDPAWMQRTFDVFWQHAEQSARFSNLMLNPPEHVQKALGAAQTNPAVARRLGYGYNEPAGFQHWLYTPEEVDAYLASVRDEPADPADRLHIAELIAQCTTLAENVRRSPGRSSSSRGPVPRGATRGRQVRCA